MFKKIKGIGHKKEVSIEEPNKSSLEPSNEKDPRAAAKKALDGDSSERRERKKSDRDGKGEC